MDNIMDPELATEMVKLFAQELKVVRAQLCEAERVRPFCDVVSPLTVSREPPLSKRRTLPFRRG